MIHDTAATLLDLVKPGLLPVAGFTAGFVVQWLLQERQSRQELVRALAELRVTALRRLWKITTLPPETSALEARAIVPASTRERIDRSVLRWYTARAGALYLSWAATRSLFRMLDLLRSEQATRSDLEAVVSSLRSRLKRDCGVYSGSETRRLLKRPRPSPWSDGGDAVSVANGPDER
jgi:hypothetical protein